MNDIILFIDANLYLRFFDTSNPKLKSLLKFLTEIKDHIFITDQIRDEVNRNKLKTAIYSFSSNYKELGIKKTTLPEHLDEHHDKKLTGWNKKRTQIISKEKELTKQYSDIVAEILISISKSTDNVSFELDKVFKLSKSPSETEIQSARVRRERGNPPGKSSDPLGDQLTWEQFLSVYNGQEVWMMTQDKDYFSEYGKQLILNPFLYKELQHKSKNKNPQIHMFNTLPDGIRDFSSKTGCHIDALPSNEEMEELRIVEETVASSNISTIGYDAGTHILEIKFNNGATYQYHKVPEKVFRNLISSASIGKFFNENIKKSGFQYVKVKNDNYD